MRMPIRIKFSEDPFDQWRLAQAGGYIVNHRGKEMFAFTTQMQYNRYLQLNKERKR
ncbi:hypothetical protein [Paenibacillus larvae]|uniref:Uncharacterized protein n=1 Tax=Paenibacillus larvae subsp. larvae TaxID=147375 RepID=A0A6C0QUP8_9BACL|nr:hypothetical protein [Paenibacillus larvae]QHZ52454.1 hypothetical protein ERICV_03343 [Paenibacillus larvae subsp. larvae]